MSELWYEAELKRPPLVTVEVENAKFVERLHQAITKCMRHSQEDVEFAETAALLSRLIARRKNSFRRMIGFRNVLKLNATTCRLLRADLQRDLDLFCSALPDMVCGANNIAALPTKNCLDYVLVRLLSVHYIQQRINDCSNIAAEYFLELLRANNFVDISMLLIAVIAKLRSLNVILANRHIDLYHNLLKFRVRFPTNKLKSLLPDSTKLPECIEYFQLPTVEADEVNVEPKSTVRTILSSSAIITNTPKLKKRTDIGTVLERTPSTGKSQQFNIEQLKTVEDVKGFISAENKARKKSKPCVAQRIPSHLWTGAQKVFERKLQAGDSKKALNVFLKFLSANL